MSRSSRPARARRNINPVTNTLPPRYARGKAGTIALDHGAFVFADTSAYSLGDALVVNVSEQGHSTWKEWASALGDELRGTAERGEPDDGSRYYPHWLATLERLVTAKGLTDRAAIDARKEVWAEAYRHTPHGKPVELAVNSATPDLHPDLRGDRAVLGHHESARRPHLAAACPDAGLVGLWAPHITPVPGGVGPMMVTMLMFNMNTSAERGGQRLAAEAR